MLSSIASHHFDRENASIARHNPIYKTPGQVKRVFDQNAGGQTTGKKLGLGNLFTPGKGGALTTAKKIGGTRTAALLDKTPAPNRQLVIPESLAKSTNYPTKIGKPNFLQTPAVLPEGAQDERSSLPSSTRKKLKLPSSATKLFDVTPPLNAVSNGWDTSNGSIMLDSPNISMVESIFEEDTDEPEYMPPPVEEPPYEHDFELPDFKVLGATLRDFATYDLEEYNPEDFVDDAKLLKDGGWIPLDQERIPVPHIDSDDESPFAKPPAKANSKPTARGGTKRPPVSKPVPSKASGGARSQRPGLSGGRPATNPLPKPNFGLGLPVEDWVEDGF